jgi:hypothetical protein
MLPATAGLATQRTIAHEILDVESELLTVKQADYALVDAIIEEARQKIPAPASQSESSHGNDHQAALQALTTIDGILVNRHFVYVLITYLSDGLTPRVLSDADFQSARDDFHNIRRIPMMDANRHKPFLSADCDIASFIYSSARRCTCRSA